MTLSKNYWKVWIIPGAFFIFGLFFEYLSYFFGYKRYIFSIEMYASFFFAVVGKKWIALPLFIFSIALELVLGMSSILYLFDISQVETILSFFSEAKKSYIFLFVLYFFLLIAFFVAVGKFSKSVGWERFAAVGILLLMTQFTFSLKEGNFTRPTLTSRGNLIFGSSLYINSEVMDLNREVYALTSDEKGEFLPIKKPSAVHLTLGDSTGLPDKVMLVVAESWGKSKDEKIVSHEISSLVQSKNISNLKIGNVSSGGATIYGEFRELCGIVPTKLKFRKVNKEDLIGCLPNEFLANGYKTVSLHGAHGTMYDRMTWYPLVGIQKMLFKETLPFDKTKECYSFPGYCDRYLFEHALYELNSAPKVFLYWMSLNSHTPYDKRDISFYDESLCKKGLGENYSEQLCLYHQLHYQFFKELENMIHDPALKGMEVIVVGDHAPIFNDEESREKFEKNQVSSISFSVK